MTMLHAETDNGILTFDGTVVEYFGRNGSNDRYHARYIAKIALQTDRKGRAQIQIQMELTGGRVTSYVKPEHMGRAEELVSAVQNAMASYRAGGEGD
jgi:hypothetical protein